MEELQLEGLIERAGELQQRVGDQAADCITYCKLCCEQGRLCCVLQTQDDDDYYGGERQRLLSIQHSLKDVQSMLLHIQSMRSWQIKNWNTAIDRLEESRSDLMEKALHYRGTEARGVIEDLEKCFGYGKITVANPKKSNSRRIFGFLVHLIGTVIQPWKWHKVARMLVVSMAMITAMSSTRGIAWQADSRRGSRKGNNALVLICSGNLDVLHGRG